MLNSISKLYRFLLFAAFLGVSTLHCVAQFDIDFSVSSGLAPALTDNPNTAPVTTLSIDLLAPQHIFTYDVTGASISANDLNPAILADIGGAAAETDTAIRDSSQAGQINPYGAGSNRLSTLFSGTGSTTRSGAAAPSGTAVDASATADQPYMDYGQPYGTSTSGVVAGDDTYRSSWSSGGGSSAFASSWGGGSAASARSGIGSDSASGSSSSVGYQSGSSLSSPQTALAVDDPYRAQPVANIGWGSPELTRSKPTDIGIQATRSRAPPTTFGAGSTDRFIARPGKVAGGIQDLYAPIPDPSALPTSSGGAQSEAPSFSSRTNASGDGSPFRSFGETDFLRPDILSAGHIDISSNSRGSSSNQERRSSSLGTTDRQTPLETSASHYGLDSNRPSTTSLSRSRRSRNGKHVNPYLAQDSSASGGRSH